MVRRSKRLLPLAAMEDILRQAGAERVAESAKAELKQALEAYGRRLAAKAVVLAQHAGRRTVMRDDVKLGETDEVRQTDQG